jgi:hypothetical protein
MPYGKFTNKVCSCQEPESSEAVVENGLYVLSAASFAKTVEAGDTFVKFYAPW